MLEQFLRALPSVASDKYAIVAYVCLVGAWLCSLYLKKKSDELGQIPKNQRAETLAKRYSLFRDIAMIVALLLFGLAVIDHLDHVEKTVDSVSDKIAAAVAMKLTQQKQSAQFPDSEPLALNFSSVYQDVAPQFQRTPEEIEAVVRNWISQNQDSADKRKQAQAQFLAGNFLLSAELSKQAASGHSEQAREFSADRDKQIVEMTDDLQSAGEAWFAANEPSEALAVFSQALTNVNPLQSPQLWAVLKDWTGVCHEELGRRFAASDAIEELNYAADDCRVAIQVSKSDTLPWCLAEDHLGNALVDLAERSGPGGASRYLDEGIQAYKAVLATLKREQSPSLWAMTHNSLGTALMDNFENGNATNSIADLQPVKAQFEMALEVYDRIRYPKQWAMVKNNFGHAIMTGAEQGGSADAHRLLEEAVADFKEALTVRTEDKLPLEWAETKMNLANALRDQADRTDANNSAGLRDSAIKIYRDLLLVYTQDRYPQNWARTESNLGGALGERCLGLDDKSAAGFVKEAIDCFQAALEVYTPDKFPRDWAATQSNLGAACSRMAEFKSDPPEKRVYLQRSLDAFRSARNVLTEKDFFDDWSATECDLLDVLAKQLEVSDEGKRDQLLGEATREISGVRQVFQQEQNQQKWAIIQFQLGNLLKTMAKFTKENAAGLLIDADACYREASEVTREDFPEIWAAATINRGAVLTDEAKMSAPADSIRLLFEARGAYSNALQVVSETNLSEYYHAASEGLKELQ